MRIISFILSVVVVLCLTSCFPRLNLGGPVELDDVPEQEEIITADVDDELTMDAEEFCLLFEGTWLSGNEELVYIGLNEDTGAPIFVWAVQDSDVFYSGEITDFMVLDENEFSMTVFFPGNEDGGFTYEAFKATVRVSYTDGENRMIGVRINDEPKTDFYFDDGTIEDRFSTAHEFWEYLFYTALGDKLIDPDTENYVRFFDVGGDPRFEFGTLGLNEDTAGVIVDMTLLEGNGLELLVVYPDSKGNIDTEEAVSTIFTVHLFGDIGVSVYDIDGDFMGDFYFGLG